MSNALKTEGVVYIRKYLAYLKAVKCVKRDLLKSYTFSHIIIMQIRSRDILRSQNLKKSLIKNSGSLNWKFFTFIATWQLTRQYKNKYKTVLGNFWICSYFGKWTVFLTSTQSPVTSNFFNWTFPLQYLNIAKHRNDIPKGLKTMQLVKKLRTQEKCTHFN